jgi:hypothetical protein
MQTPSNSPFVRGRKHISEFPFFIVIYHPERSEGSAFFIGDTIPKGQCEHLRSFLHEKLCRQDGRRVEDSVVRMVGGLRTLSSGW